MAARILIVEDDRDIAELLRLNLSDMGHEVTVRHDGKSGRELAVGGAFDLIILDIMLPGDDGLDILKSVRARSGYVPVLMLTSRSSELDRVLGLELGSDDYITKPFSIRELQARVKALLRRAGAMASSGADGEPLERGDLMIDPGRREAVLRGKTLQLTAKEFDLLYYLARHPGVVHTRAQLLNSLWGYAYEGYEHTVNSHINRLRSKIEKDPAHPVYILTVRGVGYKFSESSEG